ncbi:hypothetical protein OF83DRAFT_1061200 [Amylostereum chailletii]|nr:hypothetical protein OF83DRAFT_1061200 [Amylostereum chailletii]
MVKKADGVEAIRVVEASEESLPEVEAQDVEVEKEDPTSNGLDLQQPVFAASSTEEVEPRAVQDLPSLLPSLVAVSPEHTRAFIFEEPAVEVAPAPQYEDPFRDPIQIPIHAPWPPAGSSPRTLDPTVYILSDKRWGSTLDLSGGDNRSAIAFGHHGWENQQWEFSKLGAGFAIRNIRNGGYLSIADFGALAREGGAPVVATSFPMSWDVEAQSIDSGLEEEEGDALIRIRWPESNLFLGLSDAAAGTKVRPFSGLERMV